MFARILLPSGSKWTRPPVPRTNWYASATATHVSQLSLIAIATLVGVTVDGSPSTRTISNAIATAAQSVQLAYATAPFVWSTTSPITWRMANATLKTVVPSFVLTAMAALSPADAAVGAPVARPNAKSAASRSVRSRRFISALSRCRNRRRRNRCGHGHAVRRRRCRGCRLGRRRRGRGRGLICRRLAGRGRRRRRPRLLLRRRRRVDAAVLAHERRTAELFLALRRQARPPGVDVLELLDGALDRAFLARLDRPVLAVGPPEITDEREQAGHHDDERGACGGLSVGARPDADGDAAQQHPEGRDERERGQEQNRHLHDAERAGQSAAAVEGVLHLVVLR